MTRRRARPWCGRRTFAGEERHLLAALFGVGSTAAQPSCPGNAAAAGIRVASSSGGLVKWCVGEQDGNAVLRVADNRSFGIEVDFPSGWTVSRDGWPDVDTAIATGIASLLTVAPPGEKKVIIGGGDTVTFSIPPGASGVATATPSSEAYLWSAVVYGLGTLVRTTEAVPFAAAVATSTLVKVIQLIFAAKDCLSSFQGMAGTAVTSVSGAVSLFWQNLTLAAGCLGDEWQEAYGATAGITSYVVGVFLWLINGLQLIGGGVYELIESGAYWNGYQIGVGLAAPVIYLPCCGIPAGQQNVKALYAQDYRPRTVPFDATGAHALTGMTWQSWGAAEAVGTGTANVNDCSPACAGGGYITAPVIVTLSSPMQCGTTWFWSKAVWHFPGSIPAGEAQDDTFTFTC
jgi:hypothetical protein